MYARVSLYRPAPDRIEDVLRLGREQIVPSLQRMAGFQHLYGLLNRESGQVVSIVLWESEAAMRATEAQTAIMREQAGQVAAASAGVAVERYEVVHQTAASGGPTTGSGAGQVARCTTAPVVPERIEELVRLVREHIAPLMQQQLGLLQVYFCLDRPGNRTLTVSFWQSREALQHAEATLNQTRAEAVQAAGTPAGASSEVYEVVLAV